MAGRIQDEKLNIDIVINGNNAQKQLGQLQASKRKLSQENEALRIQKAKLISQGKKESSEYKILSKRIKENNVALQNNKIKQNELRKEIGLTSLSKRQLIQEVRRLESVMDNFTPGTDEWNNYNKQLLNTKEQLKRVRNEMNGVKNSIQNGDALDKFTSSYQGFLSAFRSGDINQIKLGFKDMKSSIVGAGKSLISLIATPIGAFIATIVSVGLGVKNWIDFNLEIERTNQLIRDLTQESGNIVDVIRIRAETLKETFGTDLNDSIDSAKSLVKNFGVTYTEAFDLIEDSAVRGKLKNGEFLDSIKEYPIQFKNAGFSAEEFVKILNSGVDLSVYKDKLPDAIKEFNLSITEQTKASKDALVNVFGSQFSETILRNVRSGKISAKEALLEISAEAEKVNLNQQQQAQLTADLFKGAGEDAGGALLIFSALNQSLNEQKKPLTEIQQIQKEQLDTNKELKGLYSQLFASGSAGFNKLIQKAKLFGTKTLIKILKSGVDVYNWFVDLNNQSSIFSGILESIKTVATSSFKVIGILIEGAWKSFSGLGKIITGVFTFDLDKIKEGFSSGYSSLKSTLANLKKTVINDAKDINNAFSGKNKLNKITLKQIVESDSSNTDVESKQIQSTGSSSNEINAKYKAFKEAEKNLTAFILKQKERRLLDDKSSLEKDLANIDSKYQKEIDKAIEHGLKIDELEAVRDEEKQALKLKRQRELNEKLKNQEELNELEKEAIRLEREANNAVTEEERVMLLLERTKYIADEQLRIEEEKEIARLKLNHATEKEILLIKEKFNLKRKKAQLLFDKGKENAEKKSLENEKIINSKRYQETSNLFGQLSQVLGQYTLAGKAAAIAQATMNTYQGVTEVWATKSTLPEPFATASRIVSTVTVLNSGKEAIKNINKTPVKGYEDGLYPVLRNDGKVFNSRLGKTDTGLVTGPTLMDGKYLAGERSTARNPEMIIDDITFSKLDPRIPEYIMDVRNGYVGNYQGYENGKYPEIREEDVINEEESDLNEDKSVIGLLQNIADTIGQNKPIVFGYSDAIELNNLLKELDSSEQNGKV